MKKILSLAFFGFLITLSGCDIFKSVDPVVPVVTTGSVTNVKPTEATVSGTVSDPNFKNSEQKDKSGSITEYGFVYGDKQTVTLENGTIVNVGSSVTASPLDFSQRITGLKAGSTYYVRAYAKNTGGVGYGSPLGLQSESFSTVSISKARISNITSNTAHIGFDITNIGNSSISEFGVAYGTNDPPQLDNSTLFKITGTSPVAKTYEVDLSGLSPNTDYRVRAYARNGLPTPSYSVEIATFRTAAPLPSYTIATHVVTAANKSGHISTIDHASLNNNPNAIVILTANWQGGAVYNKSPVGVYYAENKWKIFNQDLAAMPVGVKYNLLITNPTSTAFKHVATASNVSGNVTFLDHPSLNGNPNAKLLVTQRWNGTYNANPIGIYYTSGRWGVFNQTLATMKAGSEFNIVVDDRIFLTEAKTGKIASHTFAIDPAIGNSGSTLFLTQYWTSLYNNQEVGVWYTSGGWWIFNEGLVNMPVGGKFFVFER